MSNLEISSKDFIMHWRPGILVGNRSGYPLAPVEMHLAEVDAYEENFLRLIKLQRIL